MINGKEFNRRFLRLFADFHPAHATIEVTARCNASCGYCYMQDERSDMDLSFERLRWAIDKLHQAGVLFVALTGGEPFIRSDILPLLDHCIKKDFFKIGILTNGTLIDDDHIAFLGKHREYFSFIKISAFSHIPEIHDGYLGIPNALRTVLTKAIKIRESGVAVLFSINLMDFNCDTFETTVNYFMDMGFPVARSISKVITTDPLGKMLRPLTDEKFFTRFLRRLPKKETLAFQSGLKKKIETKKSTTDQCVGLVSNIHVRSGGDLSPCASFRKLTVGNIFDERPIPQILRESAMYNRIRSPQQTDIPACRQCSYSDFCRRCLGLAHSEFGEFGHAPEQYCNFHKALHEFGLC